MTLYTISWWQIILKITSCTSWIITICTITSKCWTTLIYILNILLKQTLPDKTKYGRLHSQTFEEFKTKLVRHDAQLPLISKKLQYYGNVADRLQVDP